MTTFNQAQTSDVKQLVYLVKIILDKCTNVCGQSPCTWQGEKCYNTFPTCKDIINYNKGEREYKFVSNQAKQEILGARPYLDNISFIATEISEEKTIPGRVTLTFLDEPDNDIGVDPYYASRGSFEAKSTFWKKLLTRNRNYKNRIVKIYEGYEGNPESEYRLRATGKISNLSYGSGTVKIECKDIITELDKIEIPITKYNFRLAERLGNYFVINDPNELINLSAVEGDFCELTNFTEGQFKVSYKFNTDETEITDFDEGKRYEYQLIVYNHFGNPLQRNSVTLTVNQNSFPELSWDVVISYDPANPYNDFRLFRREVETDDWRKIYQGSTPSFIDLGVAGISEVPPENASLILEKMYSGFAPYFGDWGFVDFENENGIKINLQANESFAKLGSKGYLKINKEYISYDGINGTQLQNIKRKLFDSSASDHPVDSRLDILPYVEESSPAVAVNKLLDLLGIDSEFIDSTALTSVTSDWEGPLVSLDPVIKKTKGSVIFFNLINTLQFQAWNNEQGKITFAKKYSGAISYRITDETGVKQNTIETIASDDDQCTRTILNYERKEISGSLTDNDNYLREIKVIDQVSEEIEYGFEEPKEEISFWLNSNSENAEQVKNYAIDLMQKKLAFFKHKPKKISFEIPLLHSDILTGSYITLDSKIFCNIDGSDFVNETFQVLKREIKSTSIKLTAIHKPNLDVTGFTTQYNETYVPPSDSLITKLSNYLANGIIVEVDNLDIMPLDPSEKLIPKNDIFLAFGDSVSRTKTVYSGSGNIRLTWNDIVNKEADQSNQFRFAIKTEKEAFRGTEKYVCRAAQLTKEELQAGTEYIIFAKYKKDQADLYYENSCYPSNIDFDKWRIIRRVPVSEVSIDGLFDYVLELKSSDVNKYIEIWVGLYIPKYDLDNIYYKFSSFMETEFIETISEDAPVLPAPYFTGPEWELVFQINQQWKYLIQQRISSGFISSLYVQFVGSPTAQMLEDGATEGYGVYESKGKTVMQADIVIANERLINPQTTELGTKGLGGSVIISDIAQIQRTRRIV